MEGCDPDAPEPLEALEPMEPEALEPEALEPMLLEPLAEGLLEPLAEDGLLAELASLEPAPLALVTVPVTATSWPMCWFSFEVSAPEGMIR